MRIASYFLIRDKGNMHQSLCEGEEHTETTRKDMWVMTLTFKNLPFLSVSTPWWAHGFLIEAEQSYPLHSRSFSLWHLPRDGREPGKVANNSLRLTASESQMSSILNHLLLTYFFFFPLYSSIPPREYLPQLQGDTSILCWVRRGNPDPSHLCNKHYKVDFKVNDGLIQQTATHSNHSYHVKHRKLVSPPNSSSEVSLLGLFH